MSRVPMPGRSANDRDIQYLMKIKRRVEVDPNWNDADRNALGILLSDIITVLLQRGAASLSKENGKPDDEAL